MLKHAVPHPRWFHTPSIREYCGGALAPAPRQPTDVRISGDRWEFDLERS
jgi:hypothetical protein